MRIFDTENAKQTRKFGEMLAREIEGGEIICLSGELGSGKTTFTQGLLKGLKVKGPHTSPTFVVLKHYKGKSLKLKIKSGRKDYKNLNIYHTDAYRVTSDGMLNLGWEEIIKDKNNVIIVEWADRIKKIVPKDCVWIDFEWIDKNKRRISFKSK